MFGPADVEEYERRRISRLNHGHADSPPSGLALAVGGGTQNAAGTAPGSIGTSFAVPSWRRKYKRTSSSLAETPAQGAAKPVSGEDGDEDGDDEVAELGAKMAKLKSPMRVEEAQLARPVGTGLGGSQDKVDGQKTLQFSDNQVVSSAIGASFTPQNNLPTFPTPTASVKSEHTTLVVLDSTGAAINGMTLQAGMARSLVLATPSQVVEGGAVYLERSQRYITQDQFKLIKMEQRTSQNLWSTDWAFPFKGNGMERESWLRCRNFICKGINDCQAGDCLTHFETSDVEQARREVEARITDAKQGGLGGDATLVNLLHHDTKAYWNGKSFGTIPYQFNTWCRVPLCVASYALLLGVKGSTAQTVWTKIKNDENVRWFESGGGTGNGRSSAEAQLARETLECKMLQQYVKEHIAKVHEQNPAPGAARDRDKQTILNKSSWPTKWKACCEFFKNSHHGREVGTKEQLKKVWQKETILHEKIASSHSKCDICKKIDVELLKLRGDNTAAGLLRRSYWERAKREHEAEHLGVRNVFDCHGFLAMTNPEAVWCICCDAATARNMELPRFNGRLPKSMSGTLPKFGLKLTAVYASGMVSSRSCPTIR